MEPRLTEAISRHRLLIAEFSFFIATAVVIIYVFGLTNESLLFVVLVFGIYLVISGRVSQFKFMNLEIVIKDIESKQLELTEVAKVQPEPDPEYVDKEGIDKLEKEIKPRLIDEAKRIRVLRIKDIRRQHQGGYNKMIASNYLKYFTHVVFVADNNVFSGLPSADELSKKIETPEGDKFIDDINQWVLNPPIRKDIYILKGASRKQVLDKMEELGLTVLPVVSGGLNYEGVIDKDSIISQITRDFYNYAKKPIGLPVLK